MLLVLLKRGLCGGGCGDLGKAEDAVRSALGADFQSSF